MKVRDYLNAKYGVGATSILYCEAKALGIPYVLSATKVKGIGT